MKYVTWLWGNSKGIRLNALVCIVAGVASVVLGLLMVWLSKRFIDANIHGVGGADTWGKRTLPPYTIDGNQPHHFSFILSWE